MITKVQILREISIEQVSKDCLHPTNPTEVTTSFRIISQNDDVVQVEACGRYFYISADALGTYWTGQWVLLWWSAPLWARTLWNRVRAGHWGISTPFHLVQRERGLWRLTGSSCGHQPEITEKELKFNLVGRLLLIEHRLRFQHQGHQRWGLITRGRRPTKVI
jgi:hypothetical protein